MNASGGWRSVLGGGLVALAAACSSTPPAPVFPDLHFTAEPPIGLEVVRIDIHNDYQPPFRAPNVDQLFPVPPMRAADDWARDRLRAIAPVGDGGLQLLGVFTLKDASVIETDLPQKTGLTAMFTHQPAKRYDLTLQASVQITDAQGIPLRTANVTIRRSQTQLEGITPNERDRDWYDMTRSAMAAFDTQMEAEIRNNFGIYYNQ